MMEPGSTNKSKEEVNERIEELDNVNLECLHLQNAPNETISRSQYLVLPTLQFIVECILSCFCFTISFIDEIYQNTL